MKYLAWEEFKDFYKEKFNATDEVVELIASIDILRLCAFGLSNSHIANLLDLDNEEVMATIDYYFNFLGYENDLDINPYNIFEKKPDFEDFKAEIRLFSSLMLDNNIKLCYNNCVVYSIARKELDKFYGAS